MPNESVIDALWRAHLGLSLGLIAVLLLRRPWRSFAGAQAAYSLWLLPLWLAAAALLPRASLPGWVLPPVLVTGPRASTLAEVPAALSIAGLWAVGVLIVTALQVALHGSYRRRLKQAAGGHLLAPAGDSPGLFGLWHARLVLPADFRQRFDASERRWILAHESAHARRLDNPARMFATVLASLAWFNPLAWWALGALRQDQELACDAAVVQRFPQCWRNYGLALLKLDGAAGLPPTASAWQSHHPLKERIMMLKTKTPAAWTRRLARTALAATALASLALLQTVVSAAPGAAEPTAARITAREACPQMPRPEMPANLNLKGDYQLNAKFIIGTDGRPRTLQIEGERQRIAALIGPVEQAVRSYQCKSSLAGTEIEQQFSFKFD